MTKLPTVLIALVALLHVGFMFMEMFGWVGFAQRVAGLPPDVAEATKPLGFNQGLYNGFLVAGLACAIATAAHSATDAKKTLAAECRDTRDIIRMGLTKRMSRERRAARATSI